MEKLGLVIADMDESYLKKLGNYIMVHHSSKFDLFTFTSSGLFTAFLKKNAGQLDIVLYGSGFSIEEPRNGKPYAIKLLDTGNPGSNDGVEVLSKYTHVEKLIKDVLHCCLKRSNTNFLPAGRKKSTFAVVHSSSGGAGKSSIAAGLSMLASRRGFRTFYLNFESIPSTRLYFKATSERSFSDVIYYLKDKEDNFALKLESACCTDPVSGVHFLPPPESVLELEELSVKDIDLLIRTLRGSSQYDFVFIDLPSGISRRNLFLLETGDRVVHVISRAALSGGRDDIMERELTVAGNGTERFAAKTLTVLNQYDGHAGSYGIDDNGQSGFHVIIGETENLKGYKGDKLLIETDTAFSAALGKLLDSLTAGCEAGAGGDGRSDQWLS